MCGCGQICCCSICPNCCGRGYIIQNPHWTWCGCPVSITCWRCNGTGRIWAPPLWPPQRPIFWGNAQDDAAKARA